MGRRNGKQGPLCTHVPSFQPHSKEKCVTHFIYTDSTNIPQMMEWLITSCIFISNNLRLIILNPFDYLLSWPLTHTTIIWMHTHIYSFTHGYIHTNTYVCTLYIHTYFHSFIHFKHTHTHTYIHTNTYVCTYIHTFIHTFVCFTHTFTFTYSLPKYSTNTW